MKEKIETFETIIPALDKVDELRKEKINGYLNCNQRKDKTYEWTVRFTPKDKRLKF